MGFFSIAEILKSARPGLVPMPRHIAGAPSSAQALFIARLVNFLGRPLVVLCPDDDQATNLAADIENLASAVDDFHPEVFTFPTWEQSPYAPTSLSIKTRLARLTVLSRVTANKSDPLIIVASIPAINQATLQPSLFAKRSLPLFQGMDVRSREALIESLLNSGYLRTDTVEDPGFFAFRGEIVDLFPAGFQKPLRVELFDSTIEAIRSFDPKTQLTSSARNDARRYLIPPAREVLVNSETAPLLRGSLKTFADANDIPRALRDPVLNSIAPGVYADRSDAWAPFAYSSVATLWDYLPADTPTVWVDELGCLDAWSDFLKKQTLLAERGIKNGLIVPSPQQLFNVAAFDRDNLEKKTWACLDKVTLASEADPSFYRVSVDTNSALARGSKRSLGEMEAHFKKWVAEKQKIISIVSTQNQLERIQFLLEERHIPCRLKGPAAHGEILLKVGQLSAGFRWLSEGLVILTEDEILGVRHARKQPRPTSEEPASTAAQWSQLNSLSDLSAGDAVVHVDHGVGRYQGLVRLEHSGAASDFLLLEYASKDRLYVPVYRLNCVQKYGASGDCAPLDRLGQQQFEKTKARVRDAVKMLAVDLIQLYAERKIRPGIRFSPKDSVFREFEAKFPFEETPDQMRSVEDILGDLESGRVMDRIVCGDVGYGKTEVAMRAAFRAISDGKQVALLVPTTVLAFQHEQTLRGRFQDYPIVIESVSRFKPAKEQKRILSAAATGRVDILVGTHRLLSRDVRFKDLGLVIVDEEHRFGVEHKEKLKTLKVDTHVLTLTATPIPRTLHMALAGLRDISLINTPPVDRLPIRTYVSKFDDELIKRAIEFELSRGGQVFFLHNRVQSIEKLAAKIQGLVPAAKVAIGHGQMSEGALEKIMLEFYQNKANVLVCTTIIESGLDVPSANTILIDRADALGLAQLYQIRGRVGRGQNRAYAYLLLPNQASITEDAKRRLEVIQRFVELGSGFNIANHDLEIRGGGDLLGPQQSGHIAAVGFDLYTELLEEAIRELRDGTRPAETSQKEPEIKIPFPAFLADSYVPDVHQRLALYRRFSAATTDSAVDQLEAELSDRFGPLPDEAKNLLWLIRIKQLLKTFGIDALTAGTERLSLFPGSQSKLDPARAIALVSARPSEFQLNPDSKFVAKISTHSIKDLFFSLETLLNRLSPSESS